MDLMDQKTRSRMMSSVKVKDTRLETAVRSRLFARGFRYRLHRGDLPGTPDMVLPKYSAAVFINGCFWHYHGCRHGQVPRTRSSWWRKKLKANRRRDQDAVRELLSRGWRVLTVWECSFRKSSIERDRALDDVTDRAAEFLRSNALRLEIPARPQ